ncbi:MAG: hypothetical protein EBX52_05495 [Proteobacteria bacterium]|nr:hypothetical protein [Pseudomonadota bacterium]
MKSRKAILSVFIVSALCAGVLFLTSSPLDSKLPLELLPAPGEAQPPSDSLLPFGYTLAPWPGTFRGEPIVTRLTYLKGPPLKFLEQLVQVWRPVEVEIAISGPKTISPAMRLEDWRNCFKSEFGCSSEKKIFWERIFPERKSREKDIITASWYESQSRNGPRGVHLAIKAPTHQIDRFAVITPKGTLQIFSMKSVLNPVGVEARELFLKTLGAMTVSDDLTAGRKSIEARIRSINFEELKRLPDPKDRMEKIITVQNWICSYLSVDPASLDSFFHLAGITHRLALDLLASKKRYFENQESWILSFQPLLGTLIQYARDFPDSANAVKNMEALLEDFLLHQSKMDGK